jgi:hypothetical protein
MIFKALQVGSLLGVLVLFGAGCAASTDGNEESATTAGAAQDLTSQDRTAILDGLRVRVTADFAKAPALQQFKLVFVVSRLESNATQAFIMARIMKRDAAGQDHELVDADYKGSVYEGDIADGLFDGPYVSAALQKRVGVWSVITKGTGKDLAEAYAVGPTDVPWVSWDQEFGIPSSFLPFHDPK